MRKFLVLLLSIILVPNVLANIVFEGQPKPYYNLGDNISVSVSITSETSTSGLLKVMLSCEKYNLEYFVTPVKLNAYDERIFSIPTLAVSDSMIGTCELIATLRNMADELIFEVSSEEFSVTKDITLTASLSNDELLPGELLVLKGFIETSHESFQGATVKIILDDEFYFELQTPLPEFSYEFNISPTIKSGTHHIKIQAFDDFSNFGEKVVTFSVIPVAKSLKTIISNRFVIPSESLLITPLLYDQAGDLMAGTANILIEDTDSCLLYTSPSPRD